MHRRRRGCGALACAVLPLVRPRAVPSPKRQSLSCPCLRAARSSDLPRASAPQDKYKSMHVGVGVEGPCPEGAAVCKTPCKYLVHLPPSPSHSAGFSSGRRRRYGGVPEICYRALRDQGSLTAVTVWARCDTIRHATKRCQVLPCRPAARRAHSPVYLCPPPLFRRRRRGRPALQRPLSPRSPQAVLLPLSYCYPSVFVFVFARSSGAGVSTLSAYVRVCHAIHTYVARLGAPPNASALCVRGPDSRAQSHQVPPQASGPATIPWGARAASYPAGAHSTSSAITERASASRSAPSSPSSPRLSTSMHACASPSGTIRGLARARLPHPPLHPLLRVHP
ncbi:hypothetical protein C8Q80DRAFT_1202685 [Daedaleopsis nitida]|nr:hypothetical protein C8Q80DRAFT_1202685 [Daedaleopsis nitida]